MDVSLSNWTVPKQRLQCGPGHPHCGRSERGRLHSDPGSEPVEHCAHLQLDARPRAPLRLPVPARHALQLRGVHVRGRQRLRPPVRQLRGRRGRLEHGQDVLHRAAKQSCEAALRGALPGAGPAQPDGRNGDVYGLQILLDGPTTLRWPPCTRCCWSPRSPRSNSQSSVASAAGGLRHDPERLRLEHRAQLGDVRQRGRQRLRGRHRHLPWHGLAGRLEHLLGAVQHADQGQRLRGRVGLIDGPAGRLAGPHGLGHAGRAHRAGQCGLRPAAVQRRELHGRVHDGRGRLGRSLLRSAHSHRRRRRSHAVVHRQRVGQLAEHHGGGQRGPAELGHRNHGQHSHHQQHAQRRKLHHRRAGPLDCESLDCTFTATSGGVSTGSVVCGDVTSSGTVSAPQLFASNTLRLLGRFLTKNWAAGASCKCPTTARPPTAARSCGCWATRARGSSWSGTVGHTSAS